MHMHMAHVHVHVFTNWSYVTENTVMVGKIDNPPLLVVNVLLE